MVIQVPDEDIRLASGGSWLEYGKLVLSEIKRLNVELDNIHQKLSDIDKDVTRLDERVTNLKQSLKAMEEKLETMRDKAGIDTVADVSLPGKNSGRLKIDKRTVQATGAGLGGAGILWAIVEIAKLVVQYLQGG